VFDCRLPRVDLIHKVVGSLVMSYGSSLYLKSLSQLLGQRCTEENRRLSSNLLGLFVEKMLYKI
jgi:hypothetical protein